jgi:hypothetical protein
MKTKVYSFARFYEPAKVQEAMRTLLSAGISRDQIRVLFPTDAAKRNSLNSPDIKRFALRGAFLGALAGLLLGGVIFVVPKYIWDYAYEDLLAAVGLILFLGVGISVGILQALMIVRRQSGDHLIKADEHGVFVTVADGEEEKLNRAKDEFERLLHAPV